MSRLLIFSDHLPEGIDYPLELLTVSSGENISREIWKLVLQYHLNRYLNPRRYWQFKKKFQKFRSFLCCIHLNFLQLISIFLNKIGIIHSLNTVHLIIIGRKSVICFVRGYHEGL